MRGERDRDEPTQKQPDFRAESLKGNLKENPGCTTAADPAGRVDSAGASHPVPQAPQGCADAANLTEKEIQSAFFDIYIQGSRKKYNFLP